MNISVILPSLNPDEKLMMVVEGLIEEGFDDIIIVNDGSDGNHLTPFKEASKHKEVTVLVHDVNKGKGRALKTAYEFCLANRQNVAGVVTVDGDNQHRPADIKKCTQAMLESGKVILGCRNFKGPDVPAKSRFGNNLTKGVFRFACGIKISDTQTGLRAFPFKYLKLMTEIKGERFEYETNVLLEMKKNDIAFDEVTIQTVYIEENATTHFHPIRDSIKIYMVIFKFLLSSFLSFIIDIALFTLIEFLIGDKMERGTKILIATAGARLVSSIFNYTMNRKKVFESDAPIKKSMPRYYILCICQAFVSYALVYLFSDILHTGDGVTSVVKLVVDIVLFIISFQIQQRWVFEHNTRKGNR